MQKRLVLILLTAVFIWGFLPLSGELDGNQLLKQSDEKMFPAVCSYSLSVETVDEDGKIKNYVTKGYKKGAAKNVMIVEQPRRMAGTVHLRKEAVIWTYYTTNQKLMKIAYQSVFMGSLLNYGDVMALELSYDYEVIAKVETETEYVLTLTPKEGHEGYAKVVLEIDKESLLPIKRSYYALSGILLKQSEFKKIEFNGQHLTYMEQEFYEPLKDKKTVAVYSQIQLLKDVPDNYFNENYLKYLGG